ncbi:MAG: hypothetical protein KA113_15440 [Syntrophaceae bacterium]|nr:hypothetical protein [Syntrophaceae bacterium]
MTLHNLDKPLSGDKCLLCGGVPSIIGVFVPEAPELFGGTKDKSRFFRYCVCGSCHAAPDTPQRVEKIIKAEIFGAGVSDD